MFIETPCIFQGRDHVYLDTLCISGRGSCLLGHPVYFREVIMFIGTPGIFEGGDHVY